MVRLTSLVSLIIVVLGSVVLSGCGSGEKTAESRESNVKAKEQASLWTPEMKEQFRQAKSSPENQR